MSEAPPSVLLVDDELRTVEVLGAALECQGFAVTPATSPDAAIQSLRRQSFDAVVTDVLFDGTDDGSRILEATRALQPEAVVVLMTGYPVISGAVSAIKRGAFDYLQKPIDAVVLAAVIHRALRERAWNEEGLELAELVEIVSDLVANTIERIDPYTAGHGERTRRYCDLLAERLGVDGPTRERLQLAAIAHDYGKIYLDDLGFLSKPGALTAREYKEVQRHPELGAEKLGAHGRLREVCRWVAEHHEKWDGTGYPLRKRYEETSLPGRILGVVEVFDSLATRRSYKDAWHLQKVLDFFEFQRERAFDPAVLDPFVDMVEVHGSEWLARPARDRASRAPQGGRSTPRPALAPVPRPRSS